LTPKNKWYIITIRFGYEKPLGGCKLKIKEYQTLKELDLKEIDYFIESNFRSKGLNDSDTLELRVAVYYLAYYYQSLEKENEVKEKIKNVFVDDIIIKFLEKTLKNHGELIVELAEKSSKEELKAGMLFTEAKRFTDKDVHSTPEGVTKLVMELLSIEEKDRVFDLGSGLGGFLHEVAINKSPSELFGVEINTSSVIVSKIRSRFLEEDIKIEQGNILSQDFTGLKANKVFSHHPWGQPMKSLKAYIKPNQKLAKYFKDGKQTVSGDWVYNIAAHLSTSPEGRTVTIMSNAGTWNKSDEELRKKLIEAGVIEGIVLLPANVFTNTGIQTTILIMSQNNESVRMVDASEMYSKGRRQHSLDQENVNEILQAYEKDTKVSRNISKKELGNNEYILNPQRYISAAIVVEEGLNFGDLCKSIHRGAMISSKELDQLSSEEETKYRYLKLQNISEGVIDESLPYLKNIEKEHEKYCLKNNNLIISKISPFKVTMAKVAENESILANGNLYFIDINSEKVNPLFVMIFLQSEKGMAELNRFAKGTAMKSISIQDLKKIQIPDIPRKEQDRIADEYELLNDELSILAKQIEKIKNRKDTLIEEAI